MLVSTGLQGTRGDVCVLVITGLREPTEMCVLVSTGLQEAYGEMCVLVITGLQGTNGDVCVGDYWSSGSPRRCVC